MFIVTGGLGFIGSNFIKKLNDQNNDDILIVDDFNNNDKWTNIVDLSFYDIISKQDLFKSNVLRNQINAVFHFGACSSTIEKDHEYLFRNNYQYSKQLYQLCLDNSIKFIYASSAATYGSLEKCDDTLDILKLRPNNMYGYSKHLFDLFIHRNNYRNAIGLKFFNVFGPRETHKPNMSKSGVTKLINQFLTEEKFSLFESDNYLYKSGQQSRDFIYVNDVVDIIYNIYLSRISGGLYNVGTGLSETWESICKYIYSSFMKKYPYKIPSFNIEYIEMPQILKRKYQYHTVAMIDKISQIIKYHPMSTKDAIDKYICEYY